MDHFRHGSAAQLKVAEVLRAARDGEHEKVTLQGPQVLAQLDPKTEASTYWLVQEALCSAAHAVDDYELMCRVADQMKQTAGQLNRTDLTIKALLAQSTARRCVGDDANALSLARQAQCLVRELDDESPVRVQLYQVLLAALVEAGHPDEAWQLHQHLAGSLHLVADGQEQGKAYWTLGNLAFMVCEPDLGVHYHQRAAELLVPAQDMVLWARFNRATAELRLQAGILNEQVQDCLQRAELAFGLIEAGDLDHAGLCLTRSRAAAVQRDPARAMAILEDFTSRYSGAPEHLVPLLSWWAQLLEQAGEPNAAQHKRHQAQQAGKDGS